MAAIKSYTKKILALILAISISWILGFREGVKVETINLNQSLLWVQLALIGITIVVIVKGITEAMQYRDNEQQEPEEEEKEDAIGFVNAKTNNVMYDSGSTLAYYKQQDFNAAKWKSIASRFQGKDHPGKGWEAVRNHALNEMRKAESREKKAVKSKTDQYEWSF